MRASELPLESEASFTLEKEKSGVCVSRDLGSHTSTFLTLSPKLQEAAGGREKT